MIDSLMAISITSLTMVTCESLVYRIEFKSDYKLELPDGAVRTDFKNKGILKFLMYAIALGLSFLHPKVTTAIALGILANSAYEDYIKYEIFTIFIDAILVFHTIAVILAKPWNHLLVISGIAFLFAYWWALSMDFDISLNKTKERNRLALFPIMFLIVFLSWKLLMQYELSLIPFAIYIIFRMISTDWEPLRGLGSGDVLMMIAFVPFVGGMNMSVALLITSISALADFLSARMRGNKVNIRKQRVALLPHFMVGVSITMILNKLNFLSFLQI